MTFALLLWFAKSINRAANRFLSLALLIIVLQITWLLCIDTSLQGYFPHWSRLPLQFSLALGPLIFFYVRKKINPEYNFRWKDLLHFIPLLLQLGIFLLAIGESTRTGAATYNTSAFHQLNPVLQLITFISVIVYLHLSQKQIDHFYDGLKFNDGDRYRLELRWLRRLMTGFALTWLLWIPFALVDYFGYHYQLGREAYYPLYILLAAMMIRIGAIAFLKFDAGVIAEAPQFSKPSPSTELKQKGAWLKKTMEANMFHQDAELSLSALAEKLGIHPHELSRIINIALKKNFNDFINEYRILDVVQKMQDPAYDRITLLGIAYDAGFNSKTTFIRAFKQLTGKSPAAYKRELENEAPTYHLKPYFRSVAIISDHETTPKWSEEKLNRNYMFRSYLRIAYRRLQKSRLYTLINLVGLTVGITSCLLIGLFIINELSYDRFHAKADRIVRMTMEFGPGGSQKWVPTGTKAGPQLKRTFPQVEEFVRTINSDPVVKHGTVMFNETRFLYADSSFFKIFSFRLLRGDPNTVLDAPLKVVITENMAKKYFGNADPIGKTLNVNRYSAPKDYVITGIVQDAPESSQVKYNFIASFISLDASKGEEWWTANYTTYLLLKNRDQLPGFQQQLNTYMRGVSKNELKLEPGSPLLYNLEPLLWVHLHSQLTGLEPNGSATMVYILGVIAFLILLIACINYTNLSTVQSSRKSTEIGIRKVLGAQRHQLFGQFMGESFLLTFGGLLMGLLLTPLLLPYFNQLTGKELSFGSLLQPLPLITLVILSILIAFASGAYPAFVLSNAKLISILKSGLKLTSSGGVFRKALIVFQFTVSVCLIAATIIVVQQLDFIRKKDLGYDREHIIVLSMDHYAHQNYESIKNAISLLPNVLSVSGANATPTFVQWGDNITADNGHGKVNLNITALPSDVNFIKTMNMKIIAGTDFVSNDFKLMDTANKWKNFRYSFILNETAARALGWTPEQAIGKTIIKQAPGTIKAVIRDFNFASLHQPIGPMMLFLDTMYTNYYFVKISGNKIPAAIESLQKLWKERVPTMPFQYSFLDDNYNSLYKTEQKTSAVFSTFSSLAILLACMGLFALSAFTTVQRTKEIGIRKVLGARVTNIILLIAKDFLKLTILAVLIATPLAWYFMHKWLQDFAYHIRVEWWVFIVAGGASVLIAFVTVSVQSIKAALTNPANSLRSE
jgi:ABC-type antimicrobial peptide transport system permease subunit/AraC-like DNA-binding protein